MRLNVVFWPGQGAGDKVSAQAFAGVLTATLALVALWL
jgi:hypothetical protein